MCVLDLVSALASLTTARPHPALILPLTPTNRPHTTRQYMDRPFRVGDTISLTSGMQSYRGEVVEVAALRTHLALEDGSTVAIPNRTLSDMIITNKSRSSRGEQGGVVRPQMD